MKFPRNPWRPFSWRIFSKTWRLTCWKLAGPKEKCKPSRHSTTSGSQVPWFKVQGLGSETIEFLEPLVVLIVALSARKREKMREVCGLRKSDKKMMMNQEIFGVSHFRKTAKNMVGSTVDPHTQSRRTWPEPPPSGRTCAAALSVIICFNYRGPQTPMFCHIHHHTWLPEIRAPQMFQNQTILCWNLMVLGIHDSRTHRYFRAKTGHLPDTSTIIHMHS